MAISHKLLSATLIFGLTLAAGAPAHASAPACQQLMGAQNDDLGIAQSDEERALDQLVAGRELLADQALRQEAKASMLEIEKLEKKIKDLRLQNGLFETQEITDKRMNLMTFETFVMLDDLNSLQAHFGSEMAATERAAIRYLSSEAIIKAYRAKEADGKIDHATAEQLVANESKDLEAAKAEFLAYASKTASVSYVLEVMKESGSIVDVTSMFGSKTKTADINGKQIAKKFDQGGLEGMAMAMPQMAAFGHAMPEHSEGAGEIKKRAAKIDENFGKYMETEPVQEIIRRARSLVGPQFSSARPTFKELSALRKRLGPDYNSTANIIARRKQSLADETKLRWKLRLMGPQLSENIHTWLGSVDKKYRKSLAPIARLAGMEYDSAMRRRHLAKILKIISLDSPKTQLTELLDGSAENPYAAKGELIVTFIRFTRAREDWNHIKRELESSEHSYDKKLVAEMEKYEEEALKRGPLSLIGPVSDPLGSVVSASVGASVVGLTGGGATWLAEKAWFQAQAAYSSENMHALLHLLHLVNQ